jgi:predicted O-methyltransferase YrrM
MIAFSRLERFAVAAVEKGLSKSRKGVLARLQDIADQTSAEFINEELLEPETLVFSSKQALREYFFSFEVLAQRPGHVLDFGVATGESTIMLGNALLNTQNRTVVGFDAFLGIRDAWSKPDRPPGAMSLGGVVPASLVDHEKVDVRVGWVEDTLPLFLQERPDSAGLVHLDMDVFPPTKFVLEALRPVLRPGSLLVFDDYFGFIGWQNHSHRAFAETFNLSSFRCVGVSLSNVAFEYWGTGKH